jgi:hypothetical protein
MLPWQFRIRFHSDAVDTPDCVNSERIFYMVTVRSMIARTTPNEMRLFFEFSEKAKITNVFVRGAS